jgi:hypothetical protein
LWRALALGDAWMPFGGKLDELTALLADERISHLRREYAAARGEPMQMILAPEPPIDPLGDPAGTIEFLAPYVALGATGFCLRFAHESQAHYCEQMAAMMAVAPDVSR